MARLRPNDLLDHLERHGLGGLMPRWSEEDLRRVYADGKIPHYQAWKDRLCTKAIGLDALMTVSALASFMKDQKALDHRIGALLAENGMV